MSEVCVKAPSPLPPLIVIGPGEYPLSPRSSNYPSVSPWRQMLMEPSPIRHSAAAWQTQYEIKANCHSPHCHINCPPPQFVFSSCSRPTVDADYIRTPIHVQPPAVGCNLFRLWGQSLIYMWKAMVYSNIVSLIFVPGLLIPVSHNSD